MARTKLTDSTCEKLTAKGGRRTRYFDTLVTGLALDVTPDGDRSFRCVYRVAGAAPKKAEKSGKEYHPKHWLTLGRYLGPARDGTELKLAKAREEARAALAIAAAGKDPADERKIAAGKTIEAIVPGFVTRFLENGAKKNGQPHAPSYVSGAQRLLENHVIPRWRGRKVADITTAHVAALLNAVDDEKPAVKGKRQKGGPIAARRTASALSKFFNWCIGEGLRSDNPVAPANRPGHETKRDRVLTPEEIATLWPCMGALDQRKRKTKVTYPPISAFCQLLIATGQRLENVAGMKWTDIKDDLWIIPRADMKDANRERKDHVVPLSPLALEILKRCDHTGDFVFQSARPRSKDKSPRPISGFGPIKRRLDKLVSATRTKDKLHDIPHWTFHDCRRTAGSLMEQELDISDRIIGAVLDHADKGVTEEHYLKGDLLKRKRLALDRWGTYLTGIVAPERNAGKVAYLADRA
jgi:integrase